MFGADIQPLASFACWRGRSTAGPSHYRTFGSISSAKKLRASRARAFAAHSKLADSSAITGIIVGLQHHIVKRAITNDFRTITVFVRLCVPKTSSELMM
jgi:hypothetical protein